MNREDFLILLDEIVDHVDQIQFQVDALEPGSTDYQRFENALERANQILGAVRCDMEDSE